MYENEKAVRSAAEAVKVSRSMDIILIFAAFLILTGAFHVHAMLTMGDWDFWTEWKDRRLWVTVTPIMCITFPAAIQAMLWERLRIPFGATFVILALIFGEWINRYFNFWGWTYFPMNYVWPAAMTPMAIWLDVVLLLTNSYILTAVVGGLGFGLLFFPTNFPMYAPFHLPVDYNGVVMSIADIQGYQYIKTGTPEYIRMVEKGTLRTFGKGKDVVPVSALFSAFFCIWICSMWHWCGRWYSPEGLYAEQARSAYRTWESTKGHSITGSGTPRDRVARPAVNVGDAAEAKQMSEVLPSVERKVNAWLEDAQLPIPVEQQVKLGVDIGRPRGPGEQETPLASQPFREPPWGDRQQLELLIGLMGPYVTVEPLWRKAVLPRQGSMEPVYFDITAHRVGPLALTLTLRLPKSMTLLQEYRLELEAYDSAKASRMEEAVP